jgi:ubiquinone/menaquinone biosynthesis C-methylase UbiE
MTGDWWAKFYDDTFADVVMATGTDATAEQSATFLIEKLGLQPGETVFDQCCGIGRMSHPLARRGIRVVGVDLIPEYIRRAEREAVAEELSCEFHVGDAFTFRPEPPCDAAFNWWSSFGYVPEDRRNVQMLRRVWESVKPGGKFALDYYNGPRLLREFQERIEFRYRTELGEFPVVRSATIRFESGMIDQEWRYRGPDDREHVKHSTTRIYLPHDLVNLLRTAGFEHVKLYGGYDGSPFSLESPRCILVARRQ